MSEAAKQDAETLHKIAELADAGHYSTLEGLQIAYKLGRMQGGLETLQIAMNRANEILKNIGEPKP